MSREAFVYDAVRTPRGTGDRFCAGLRAAVGA
jgi:hypothetical protein